MASKAASETRDHQTDVEGPAVRPVTLRVPGRYWDSQLYAGRLYLFEQDGSLRTVDWDRLIDDWSPENDLDLAVESAFRRSSLLYREDFQLMLSDKDARALIVNKFERLASRNLDLEPRRLEALTIKREKNRFPFPHSDSTIYDSSLYVASSEGLSSVQLHRDDPYDPVGWEADRAKKRWDARILGLSASYQTLALAAGTDGLFELSLRADGFDNVPVPDDPIRRAEFNCTACSWVSYNIYGSSASAAGGLAMYRLSRVGDRDEDYVRQFESFIPAVQIFGTVGYSWGSQDKLCQLVDGHINVVQYARRRWRRVGGLEVHAAAGVLVSAATALYGLVLEFEHEIRVLCSDGSIVRFEAEPVNWRIFPRSRYYENQLHILHDDYLEVVSLNQDYFVDQKQKLSGATYQRRRVRAAFGQGQ